MCTPATLCSWTLYPEGTEFYIWGFIYAVSKVGDLLLYLSVLASGSQLRNFTVERIQKKV